MANAEVRSAPPNSVSERAARFGRDWNIVDAAALGGVALVIPGPNVILGGLTALNVAQAGGFEWLRRRIHNRQPAH